MKTLVLLSQKGGSGKTTLAVHCAVAAEESGELVALADTDPQQSASMWAKARTAESPNVVTTSAIDLGRVLSKAREQSRTLTIVDSAPHTATDAVRIVQFADLICIPCRPTAFDIAAIEATVTLVKANGKRAVFVLSACPSRAPEIDETRSILSGHGFPIYPGQITERRSFARAVATGRAVTEFENTGRAAEEVRQLWVWLKRELKK